MSGIFNAKSNTMGSFHVSKQEEYIRQIVQNQLIQIFNEIKIQIQTKIKSIDKSIDQIKKQVKSIYQNQQYKQIGEVIERIQKIQAQIQIVKYHHEYQIKNSRTRSLDKQRKPIFKKTNTMSSTLENADFSNIILDLQTKKKQTMKNQIKKQLPPLPVTNSNKTQKISQNTIYAMSSQNKKNNNILQDSTLIHKWLTQNKVSSCFESVKQQDVEESVYY